MELNQEDFSQPSRATTSQNMGPKYFNILLVIVSLFFIITFAGLIYFYNQNQLLKQQLLIKNQSQLPTNILIVTKNPTSSQQEPSYDFITYKSKDYEGVSYSIDIPKNWKVEDKMVYIPSAMSASDPTNKNIFIEVSPSTTTDGSSNFTDNSSQDAIIKSKRYQITDINGQRMLYTEFDDSAGYTIIAKNNRRYNVQIWGVSTNPELITMLQSIIKSFKFRN